MRLPGPSLRAPEITLVIEAVASAMPSMMPAAKVEVPNTVDGQIHAADARYLALSHRYSERKESGEALMRRVNLSAATS